MTSPAVMRSSATKAVRHLEKPKPLKSTTFSSARHSAPDVPGRLVVNVLEEVMDTVECLTNLIINKNYAEISAYTSLLSTKLRVFGLQLEDFYKDKLDRAFIAFRDASKDEKIDFNSRVNLLELVELRAMKWQANGSFSSYYGAKGHKSESSDIDQQLASQANSTVLHLAPGEVIKPSGKYASPTKMAGKNYCKDEIVIRNSDSGKVMGIKGRRVHMIEELSETVISFQRVNPGAKERLVQITGPNEDKIVLACNLIEDTIKRNASPVREISDKDHQVGSSSSLNSSASDDNINLSHSASENLFLSSTNESNADTINYRYSFHVGSSNLFLVSDDYNLITRARLYLEDRLNGGDKPASSSNVRQSSVENVEIGVQCNGSDLLGNNTKVPLASTHHHSSNSPESHKSIRKVKSFSEYEVASPTQMSQYSPTVPTSPSYLKDGFPKREYTRNYLLSFADCTTALAKPRNWDRIAAEFPNLISELKQFDLAVYLRKWKELEGKNIVLPSGDASSDTD